MRLELEATEKLRLEHEAAEAEKLRLEEEAAALKLRQEQEEEERQKLEQERILREAIEARFMAKDDEKETEIATLQQEIK